MDAKCPNGGLITRKLSENFVFATYSHKSYI